MQYDAKYQSNMLPKTPQHAAQNPPRPPNLRPRCPQDPHPGAKMAPRSPILAPRWHQDPSTWSQDGPKTPQLGAKMAPRPSILELQWEIPPVAFLAQVQHTSNTIASNSRSTHYEKNSNTIANLFCFDLFGFDLFGFVWISVSI